eukprot:TRINITY_DN14016_c0_g1_i1.p1 TRINITY_DN14016_c0_g1~~TRINITY_DN14016_c0_g1_i1.p1  ORF type:complete len:477 (+),score=83.07 TRINITY_DN14016_c0_g1_i1:52-1431(+)
MHQRKARRTLLPQSTTPLRRFEREHAADDVEKADNDVTLKLEYDSMLTAPPVSPEKTLKVKTQRTDDSPERLKRVRIAEVEQKHVFSQKVMEVRRHARFLYPENANWCWLDSIVVLTHSTVVVHPAIAGFSLEGCLVKEGSGDSPQLPSFLYSEVAPKLTQLSQQSKRIVVFANSKMSSLDRLKANLISLINSIGIPIEVYVSIADDHIAMPSKGLWDAFISQNESVMLDLKNSFFCGSTARDQRFADNIGISYVSSDQLFLGTRQPSTPAVKDEPENQPKQQPEVPVTPAMYTNSKSSTGPPEIVVLVGPPGAGKSTFYRKYLLPFGYNHVCKERLGTDSRCVQMAASALTKGQRVLIDGLNQTQRLRNPYSILASRAGVGFRCFWFDTSPEMSSRLCKLRTTLSEGISKPISAEVHSAYHSSFQPPSMSEGFTEMRRIRFSLSFESPRHKHVFDNNL